MPMSLESVVTTAVMEYLSLGKVRSTTYQNFLNLEKKGINVYQAIENLQNGNVLKGYFAYMAAQVVTLEEALQSSPSSVRESIRDAITSTKTWKIFAVEQEKLDPFRYIKELKKTGNDHDAKFAELKDFFQSYPLPKSTSSLHGDVESPTGFYFHYLNRQISRALVAEFTTNPLTDENETPDKGEGV